MALLSTIGTIINSSSQRKASNRIVDASQENNAANNALAREIYGQNKDILNPFVQRGNVAGETYNALLGLGGPRPAQATPATPNVQAQYQGPNPDTSASPWARAGYAIATGSPFDADFAYNPRMSVPAQGTMNGNVLTAQNMGTTAVPQGATVPAVSAQQAANDAFDIYKNSTGYQFRVNEGNRALNSGWAGAGTLQSGAAGRAFADFGQNIASQEFGNYMNMLGNQQAAGLSAGSALAGVGQNYTGQVTANNNAALGVYGNAQLVRAANNPFGNALTNYGGVLQNLAGAAAGGGFG